MSKKHRKFNHWSLETLWEVLEVILMPGFASQTHGGEEEKATWRRTNAENGAEHLCLLWDDCGRGLAWRHWEKPEKQGGKWVLTGSAEEFGLHKKPMKGLWWLQEGKHTQNCFSDQYAAWLWVSVAVRWSQNQSLITVECAYTAVRTDQETFTRWSGRPSKPMQWRRESR